MCVSAVRCHVSRLGSQTSGTVLTLSGSGFDATVSTANTVEIGGVACDVVTATGAELTCSVGRGPAGSHDVVINVLGKGLAEHTGGVHRFVYSFQVTGIDPATGGNAGRLCSSHSYVDGVRR